VFTVETEADGSAYIRFGDDEHGVRPSAGTAFTANYRVGNGPEGNVGAGTIAHIVTTVSGIAGVTNPLPARGGSAPESVEHVRQSAPFAFRTQQRAVTAQDYAAVAQRYPGVERAAATFRWTGSWYTVFVTVERPGGKSVDAAFEGGLREFLEHYRMAGNDVEIEQAEPVRVNLTMHICVAPDFFQSDVRAALLRVFNSQTRPDGTPGLFSPDSFSLGQPFYLSPLIAAAQEIEGVQSVRIVTFERQDRPGGDGLKQGYLSANRLEVFTLDNDPNFPERGKFRLDLDGGR
jgi:predicted phage baseplate assembly protein